MIIRKKFQDDLNYVLRVTADYSAFCPHVQSVIELRGSREGRVFTRILKITQRSIYFEIVKNRQ